MGKLSKLNAKLVGFVSLLSVVLILVALVAFGSRIRSLADSLMEEQLTASCNMVEELFSRINTDDYLLKDGDLYKGDINLTSRTSEIDKVGKMAGVEISVLWGAVRKTTTLVDASGNRAINTTLDSSISSQVLAGKSVFLKSLEIQGIEYTAYYMPLRQPSSGEIVGMIFTGKEKVFVRQYVDNSVLGALGILIVITVGFVLTGCLTMLRGLTKALVASAGYTVQLADRHLNITIDNKYLTRSDEIGDIARNLDLVRNNLHGVIEDLQSSAIGLDTENKIFMDKLHSISQNIESINVAVEEVAKGSTSQADETSKASESVVSIGKALDQNMQGIRDLSTSTVIMSEYAKNSYAALQELIKAGKQTAEEVEVLKGETHNTNDSARGINEAISLIQGIAQQTNLLSLNASIEAARAGDSGRGFAVVAEEIRNLSEESSKGATQISQIVNQLVDNSNVSVERMGIVEKNITGQLSKLEVLDNTFVNLEKEVDMVSEAVKSLAEQSKEIMDMKDDISSVIGQLAAISQENAAATQETSASMQDLSGAVDECVHGTDKLLKLSNNLSEKAQSFEL